MPDPDGLLRACLADGVRAGRVLVVVAHPDDEVLGCGALLSRLGDVRVVIVTDGAPRHGDDARRQGFASMAAYAAARAAESRHGLALAGVPPERLSWLGMEDQDVARRLADLARRLAPQMAQADLVLTHAFEGGHPDHDAVAFAVQAAVHRTAASPPVLVEMPYYHAALDGWHRQVFLPHPGAGPEHVLVLGPEAQGLKARMVAAHASQGDTLYTFDGTTERFRVAPRYDFTARPHDGDLLYERHGWNLDWAGWVDAVRAAEAVLDGSWAA